MLEKGEAATRQGKRGVCCGRGTEGWRVVGSVAHEGIF